MAALSRGTFHRPESMADKDDPRVLYVKSYLLIRTIVGLIGILLPIALIIGEAYFLRGGVHVKGSISAYYHTSMRDIFVSSLCVAGFLLATYMAGQAWTWDFWLSLVAGVAVLFVVFFPTERPGIPEGAPLCGETPEPAGCSPIQQDLGETAVAAVHFTAAIIFILSLAAICFLFAYREKEYKDNDRGRRFHTVCGVAILAAIGWAIIGGLLDLDIWELTPLYVGEVIAVWAFGASWLAKGKNLRSLLGPEKLEASAQPGD